MFWWLMLGAIPVLFGMGLGFFEWSGTAHTPPRFVWFDNYINFFRFEYYYMSLWRAFYIGGLCAVVGLVTSLFVASVVNKMVRAKAFFRSVWYIPTVVSPVVATMIFNIFLEPHGAFNNILANFGRPPILWLQDRNWAIFWIVVYSTWKSLGGSVLLWLAAFQSVDRTLDEAAALDGANSRQTFWHVQVPQMMPIIIFILITTFGGMIQVMEPILFITNGGPFGQTEVIAFRILRDTFWDRQFGMAGASSMIILAVTFGFILIIFRMQKRAMKEDKAK